MCIYIYIYTYVYDCTRTPRRTVPRVRWRARRARNAVHAGAAVFRIISSLHACLLWVFVCVCVCDRTSLFAYETAAGCLYKAQLCNVASLLRRGRTNSPHAEHIETYQDEILVIFVCDIFYVVVFYVILFYHIEHYHIETIT